MASSSCTSSLHPQQTTSVRLLLNLVENIFHKNEPEGRALVRKCASVLPVASTFVDVLHFWVRQLVRVLQCLVCKFATLRTQIPKQVHLSSLSSHSAPFAFPNPTTQTPPVSRSLPILVRREGTSPRR